MNLKDNLIILIGALLLTFILFTPARFHAICPFFVDQNQDGLCDILYPPELISPPSFNFSYLRELMILILFLTISIILQFSNWKYKSVIRYLILSSSLFYFGFLFYKQICPMATFQSIFVLKEKVVLTLPLFLIFLLPIITTLLFGRIFCYFICPIGAFQELIFKAGKLLPIKLPNLTPKMPRKLFYLPYFILGVTILTVIFTSSMTFCKIEPWGVLFGCKKDILSFVIFILFLISLPFLFRPFCQFFCPYGAILKILAEFKIISKKK